MCFYFVFCFLFLEKASRGGGGGGRWVRQCRHLSVAIQVERFTGRLASIKPNQLTSSQLDLTCLQFCLPFANCQLRAICISPKSRLAWLLFSFLWFPFAICFSNRKPFPISGPTDGRTDTHTHRNSPGTDTKCELEKEIN